MWVEKGEGTWRALQVETAMQCDNLHQGTKLEELQTFQTKNIVFRLMWKNQKPCAEHLLSLKYNEHQDKVLVRKG